MKVVYSDTYLVQRPQMDQLEVSKLEQAIAVHGYRGPSKFKHNGVVNIKPNDKQLWKSITKFKEMEKTLLPTDNFFVDVKVVGHVPNGDRIVGSLYRNTNNEFTLYLLGFSNYNHQLF